MRIGLFALTGFGNPVLAALCASGFRPDFIATRNEPSAFPHYHERPLSEMAADLDIPCLFDAAGPAMARTVLPDVIVVATYHRLLVPDLLDRVTLAINAHPSLLPCNRGPNPFFWTIANGESETGVTVHRLTAGVDDGPILWQEKVALTVDETQGSLRRRLAGLAAEGLVEVLSLASLGCLTERPQDETVATAFPKPGEAHRIIDFTADLATVSRRIRALTPSPGALLAGRRLLGVLALAPGLCSAAPGTAVVDTEEWLQVCVADGVITLRAEAAPVNLSK
jgi:methionyl-tRNA formyltransferase